MSDEYDPTKCSFSPDDAVFLRDMTQKMFGKDVRLGWDADVTLDGVSIWCDEQTGRVHIGMVWYSGGGQDYPPDGGVNDLDDYTPTSDIGEAVFRFLREVFEVRIMNAAEVYGEEQRANFELVEQIMES